MAKKLIARRLPRLGKPLGRRALIRAIRSLEKRIRIVAARWNNAMPASARYELLLLANEMLEILLREPKAIPPRRRRVTAGNRTRTK